MAAKGPYSPHYACLPLASARPLRSLFPQPSCPAAQFSPPFTPTCRPSTLSPCCPLFSSSVSQVQSSVKPCKLITGARHAPCAGTPNAHAFQGHHSLPRAADSAVTPPTAEGMGKQGRGQLSSGSCIYYGAVERWNPGLPPIPPTRPFLLFFLALQYLFRGGHSPPCQRLRGQDTILETTHSHKCLTLLNTKP